MLTTALLLFLSYVLSGVALLLPSSTLFPLNFSSLVGDVRYYVYAWDWLIPATTLFSVIGIGLTFVLAEILWKSLRYVTALIRGN